MPIFVHPKDWSELHLVLLRIRGLDMKFSLEHVVGQLPPWDQALETISIERSSYYRYDIEKTQRVLYTSLFWLETIYEKKGYRTQLGYRWRLTSEVDHVFHLNFGNEKPQRLHCLRCFHDWPDENEYPVSFPVVAVMGRNCDYYLPPPYHKLRFREIDYEILKKKRKGANKDAEEVALLIALSQKHAEILNASKLAEDDEESRSDERLRVFRPVLMIATTTTVHFVKATITKEYLETFADPTLPLCHDLTIEKSVPIDMTTEETDSKLLTAIAALIDSYSMNMAPLLA